ncbi:hypothetical protein THASP1DRAFT_24759 [Thamnocephalis sphaerospora]|uniref:Uncharacterized protein n=1 Tax=Thamnocephalis sphaerospora TaxID=78915 RepID=A0A4P9XNM1_9FUNG|nr:hypothetical protein THASP1DRAFT_24759 [Thamnocephalis sphaerospora]|eukprot:RKP07011.1 hypothetical protein THASP1DRAFT_24759 [Thamnocephalis sphaerospora]
MAASLHMDKATSSGTPGAMCADGSAALEEWSCPIAPTTTMSSMDNVLMRLEAHGHPAYISTFFWLEGHVSTQTFHQQIRRLCDSQPKLLQIPVGGSFWRLPQWVDVREYLEAISPDSPAWKLEDQLEEIHIQVQPAPGNDVVSEADERAVLEKRFDDFISQPPKSKQPLWRACLIHGLQGRTVFGFTAHHAMVDGVGLAATLASTFLSPGTLESGGHNIHKSAQHKGRRVATMAVTIAQHHILPRRSFRHHGPPASRRNVAWSRPIPLQQIAQIRRAHPHATLNDVMLAAVTISFRKYMAGRRPSREDPDKPMDMYASDGALLRNEDYDDHLNLIIPVSQRPPGNTAFENRVRASCIFVSSFDRYHSTEDLLHMICQRTRQLKRPILMPVLFEIGRRVFDLIPGLFPSRCIIWYLLRSHCLISNIPGPTDACYFDAHGAKQHRIIGCAMFPPAVSRGMARAGFCSYNGHVYFSIMTDATDRFCDMARKIADNVTNALEFMAEEVG